MTDQPAVYERLKEFVSKHVSKNGGITAVELVDMAKPENSPIHDAFEWDDSIAAHEFRLSQGRRYLREIEINYVPAPKKKPIMVELQWVPPARESGTKEGIYRPLIVVANDEEQFQRALEYCMRVMASSRRAVERLLESVNDDAPRQRRDLVDEFAQGVETMERALAKIEVVDAK